MPFGNRLVSASPALALIEKCRDAVLERQVHTFQYKELLFWTEASWQPGSDSHRNALFWYEAVLDNRPLSAELPTRTTKWMGARCKPLESHFDQAEKPIRG